MNTPDLIHTIYKAFNERRTNDVLALMTEDVSWPKASEGGRVTGKNEISDYWTRQWAEFDPQVNVLEIIPGENRRTNVRVHQVVKDRAGQLLSASEVWHNYTIANGLVQRMDLGNDETSDPSAAFAKHNASTQ